MRSSKPDDKKSNGFKNWFIARSNFTKFVFIAVILVIVWFGYKKFSTQKNSGVQTQTATAVKGTIVSTVSASGTVVSANTFTIKTQASGVVSNVYVKDGQKVNKGQKIADIELDLDGEQQYAQAYSSYIGAKVNLESANNNLRSATASLNNVYDQIKGHETDESFTMIETRTKAEISRDNANNSVISAKANLANAEFNLRANSPTVLAPNSGTVQGLTIAEGLPLSAQTTTTGTRTGQRIASIIKTGNPLISVNLSEIDVPKVKVGQKATITFDSITDKTFTGIITAIDRTGSTSSSVTSYPAIITLDSGSDQILPNMAVTANIITEVKDNVLLVPSSAIKNQNGQSTVAVIEGGSETTVNVETGISSDSQTEIVSGISEGDTVVTGTSSTGSANSSSARSVFSSGFGGGNARFIGR
jgi:membrane fusion protein, macrolide-specific efflux system